MRAAISFAALLLYVILFNFYIYELTNTFLSYRREKLLYDYTTSGMVIYFLIDLKTGFENDLHEQANLICILAVIMNFLFIILTLHDVLADPVKMFLTFNGSIIVTTTMILFFGIKYEYFKDTDENDRAK